MITDPSLQGQQENEDLAPKKQQPYTRQLASNLGGGMDRLFVLGSTRNGQYTTEFLQAFEKFYTEKLAADKKPMIQVLDKAVIPGLAYSSIIVSMRKDTRVSYFVVLLAATGALPMTAKSFMAGLEIAEKTKTKADVFTIDDAIDDKLDMKVRQALSEAYGGNMKFISVEALIVPGSVTVAQQVTDAAATIAYNACCADAEITSGIPDVTIPEVFGDRDYVVRINHRFPKSNAVIAHDAIGSPVRADFTLELVSSPIRKSTVSLNDIEQPIKYADLTGFIEMIPEATNVSAGQGQPLVPGIRLRPNIVVTSIGGLWPTTGFSMLSIMTALLMSKQEMWLGVLAPRADYNIGNLNLFTNIEFNPQGGVAHDLTNKKLSQEEVYGAIKKMASLDPVISIDVPSFGPETHYLSALATAASSLDRTERINASKEIIATLHSMTDGKFPSDFPTDRIFAFEGIDVPTGHWETENGTRDIRDVDLAFVTRVTKGDMDLPNKWVKSMVSRKDNGGEDPFILKTMVLSTLLQDNAVFTGKAKRITFSAEFVAEMMDAAIGSGFDFSYNPEILMQEGFNYGMTSSVFANAGVAHLALGRAYNDQNGQSYSYKPYSNTMGSRYGR